VRVCSDIVASLDFPLSFASCYPRVPASCYPGRFQSNLPLHLATPEIRLAEAMIFLFCIGRLRIKEEKRLAMKAQKERELLLHRLEGKQSVLFPAFAAAARIAQWGKAIVDGRIEREYESKRRTAVKVIRNFLSPCPSLSLSLSLSLSPPLSRALPLSILLPRPMPSLVDYVGNCDEQPMIAGHVLTPTNVNLLTSCMAMTWRLARTRLFCHVNREGSHHVS
jgi:hypothetical protein